MHDPAIPLMGIYPEKTLIQKDTCTPMFIAALFAIAKTWKQPKCLIAKTRKQPKCLFMDRCMDKDVVYICVCVYIYMNIYNEILLSHKKE